MVTGLGWGTCARITLVIVALATGSEAVPQTPPPIVITLQGEMMVIKDAGSELVVRRNAPVRYRTVSQLDEEIRTPLPPHVAVIRLVRAGREMHEYVLCVTNEGLLVLGEQRRDFDYGGGAFVFVRGEIWRAFQPLQQPGPWTWLLEIPLSRERRATLQLRTAAATWPVDQVAISPVADR